MSLINDALKRAKEAQPKAAASAPGPQLRPVEPQQTAGRGIGITMPGVLAVLLLAGLLALWLARPKSSAQPPLPVEAKAPAAPVAETPKLPVTPVHVSTPSVAPAALPAQKPATPAQPAVTAAAPAPEPALKLQMVSYIPGNPSAVISGKTVAIGETVKGFRVRAITATSATLVSATATNVLSLEQ
jgi:outer membrane biosynthesis protein TonB